MAIRTVVTRGFGNGTFNGTIGLVVTRGYSISAVTVPTIEGLEYTFSDNRLHYSFEDNKLQYDFQDNKLHYSLPEED